MLIQLQLLIAFQLPVIPTLQQWPIGFTHKVQISSVVAQRTSKGHFSVTLPKANTTSTPKQPASQKASQATKGKAPDIKALAGGLFAHPQLEISAEQMKWADDHAINAKRSYQAKASIRQGKIDEAISLLTTPTQYMDIPADPGVLADCYWIKGRPDLAYAVMSKAAQGLTPSPTGGDVGFWIRASVAAAQNGEVYAGQRDYILNWIRRVDPFVDPNSLPAGNTAKEVLVLSYFALSLQTGSENEAPAGLWAIRSILELDPGNPEASLAYMAEMSYQCHRQELARVYYTTIGRTSTKRANLKHLFDTSQWFVAHPSFDRKNSDNYDMWPDLK